MENNEQKQEILDLLVGYTRNVGDFTGTVVEWMHQQAPELMYEILLYARVSSLITLFGCIASLALLYYLGVKAYKNIKEEGLFFSIMGLMIASAFPISLGYVALLVSVKSWISPRLYLLEYLKDFI